MEEKENSDENRQNDNENVELTDQNINNSGRETSNQSSEAESVKDKKKGCHFPTAYTILVIIELIFFILTYIIPKGKYDKIEYSESSKKLIRKSPNKPDEILNATQQVLDELGIKIDIDNFLKGYIKNEISIPNTYQTIEGENNNIFKVFVYPILGLIDSSGICFFLFAIGGCINLLLEMNALSAGIAALGKITKGREFILLILIFVIISIGGTTYGLAEEILAFFPILMPIFLKSGFDAILGISPLIFGSMIGSMFSTVNAFSVVIASYSSGVNFTEGLVFRLIGLCLGDIIGILYLYFYYLKIKKDKKKSVVYDIRDKFEQKYLKQRKEEEQEVKIEANEQVHDDNEENLLLKEEKKDTNDDKFTWLHKLGLIFLLIAFVGMIFGVVKLDWSFTEMTAAFLVLSIILMFLFNQGEQKGIEVFISGAGDFLGVCLVIGLARGINITLNEGNISDTILYFLSNIIKGLPKVIFAIIMLLIFIFLGIFIQSSSGMAVLTMPVFSPLADNSHCSRVVIIDTYLFGLFLTSFVAPTGLVIIALQLIGVPYNYWIKFIWPFWILLFIFLIVLIIIDVLVN